MNNTHTVKTTNGYEVVIKNFLNREAIRYIGDSFLDTAELMDNGKYKMNSASMHEAENRTIEMVVVSISGPDVDASLPVVKQSLAMRDDDFEELLAEINKVYNSKKKETNTSTT